MTDPDDGRITGFAQELDELSKCISDLFDHPERQLQAAFAMLVGIVREQAAAQLKLHKSFDALSENQSGKELAISSCCNKIEKLSNDYQSFQGTNDDILRNIDRLTEQIKDIAGLCFGSSFIDNVDILSDSYIGARSPDISMSEGSINLNGQECAALNFDSSGKTGAAQFPHSLGSEEIFPTSTIILNAEESLSNDSKTSDVIPPTPLVIEALGLTGISGITVNKSSNEHDKKDLQVYNSIISVDILSVAAPSTPHTSEEVFSLEEIIMSRKTEDLSDGAEHVNVLMAEAPRTSLVAEFTTTDKNISNCINPVRKLSLAALIPENTSADHTPIRELPAAALIPDNASADHDAGSKLFAKAGIPEFFLVDGIKELHTTAVIPESALADHSAVREFRVAVVIPENALVGCKSLLPYVSDSYGVLSAVTDLAERVSATNLSTDALLPLQKTERIATTGDTDPYVAVTQGREFTGEPTVRRYSKSEIPANHSLDGLNTGKSPATPPLKKEITITDVPLAERTGREAKTQLQHAAMITHEDKLTGRSRRTSVSFGTDKLSMDNALGYRVRRLEDLVSSVDDKVQLMKATNEKHAKVIESNDSVETCSKEEMNLLACRLAGIEKLLLNLMDSRKENIDSSILIVKEERNFCASSDILINAAMKTNQEDIIIVSEIKDSSIEETNDVSQSNLKPFKSSNLSPGKAVDDSQPNSTPIQDGVKECFTMTSNDQQTEDFIGFSDVQKMLACQVEIYNIKCLNLSTQINDLKEQLFERTRRPSIQDILLSSGVAAAPESLISAAMLDDVYGRLDNTSNSLITVESKIKTKVSHAELCNLIRLLTKEGPIDYGDALVSTDIAVIKLSSFKKNYDNAIENLTLAKADRSDTELSLRQVEDRVFETFEELIKKNNAMTEKTQQNLQKDIDDCRSFLDLFDSKLQFIASATSLDPSNSAFDSQIDAKIKESMHAVHASLEEAVSKKLEDISALENELERVISHLAEKPDEKQLRAMFSDLEKTLSARIGDGTTVQVLLSNIRMEVMDKMTKIEVLELVKQIVDTAKQGVRANEEDGLMIGTAPFRCLGCDQIFPRGVHNKLANKKNHQALPSSGYLKKKNLYLDPSPAPTSSSTGQETIITLPPMHSGRRPQTSTNASHQQKSRRAISADHRAKEHTSSTRTNNYKTLH